MKITSLFKKHGCALMALVAIPTLFIGLQSADGHPYASGLTNTAGTISYILNENADNVKVVFENNSTNDLGAQTKGVHSFPLSGHTSYSIYVAKAGSGVPSLISPVPAAGANTNFDFNGPRGVAVNNNAKRHNFGRIYVCNANPGTHFRSVGKGLYVLNADGSDPLGYGTNVSPPQVNFPASGAQWWGGSTTYGPYRPYVGPDDTVYVGDSSGSGNTAGTPVWMIDPDLTTPIEMFSYVGSVGGSDANAGPCQSKPVVTGSLATGDLTLTCMMWNYNPAVIGGSYQSVLRYNIGAGPIDSANTWTANPVLVVTNAQPGFGAGGVNAVTEDVTVGPNGYVYVNFNRSNGGGIATGNNELWVYDNNVPANLLWASSDPLTGGVTNGVTTNPTNDCFQAKGALLYGASISPDGQYLGFGDSSTAKFTIVKLTNGIPDKASIATYAASNTGQRGSAFDAADNFYTVEGNSDSLKIYSLGLTTTCVTSNDTTVANGSFRIVLPPTTVSVVASTPNASQGSPTPVPGVFTITRQGQLTAPLFVGYTLAGTASNSTYTVASGATTTGVTLAIGQASTNVTITPVHDSVPRLTTTVILNLAGGTNYSATAPNTATIAIRNTATPQLVVSAGASSMYKPFTNDYTSVNITRLGDTNTTFPVSTFSFGGTAVANVDYAALPVTTFALGDITKTVRIARPLNPSEPTYAGNKTIIATLANNGGTYTVLAGANSQVLTIIDNAYPPATVLYSNPLASSDDATNWNTTFVNRDGSSPGPGDVVVDFGFDVTVGSSPSAGGFVGTIPLPPNGSNTVLRVSYNKAHGISGAVNLYMTNMSFSGDYAVRFNMYAAQGSTLGSSTEGPLFGINHDGMETNWWAGSGPAVGGPWTADGVWFWMDADAGGALDGDYTARTGIANTIPNSGWTKVGTQTWPNFTNVFKNPEVFTTFSGGTNSPGPGMPANAGPYITNGTWADVEIKQVANRVTWSIDKTPILTYQNTNSLFQSGMLMLGHEDPFDSIGSLDAATYYSNLRVVRLGSPFITATVASGSNILITFSSIDGDDTTSSFVVQSSTSVTGPYTDVSPAATITQDPSSGLFTATVAQNGPQQFYRIRHL